MSSAPRGDELGADRQSNPQRPLVVATNREPHQVRRSRSGNLRIEQSAGGLVSALAPALAANGGAWFAWNPNCQLDEAVLARHAAHELTLIPVYEDEVQGYYRGFANGALWPLCHYALDRCRFRHEDWRHYVDVNGRFAEKLAAGAAGDRLVWVHDYHLMLVPEFVRERCGPGSGIAYFHHIPFPAADLFRVLPWHKEVLRGLLGADLVGFHSSDYVDNFLDACRRLVGADVDLDAGRVRFGGREIEVGAFPIGIAVDDFERAAGESTIQAQAAALRRQLGVDKLILGVDRLDYTKGIQQRLAAIDRLLTKTPSLRGVLSLIQIAAPSRTDVPEYRSFKKELDETVGRINGKHAQDGWQPIHCVYRTFGRRKLIAHYLAADVALVTPLRDGMNLVAKEFCAARTDCDGVLLLSEFAGAAESLAAGAVMVNPFDTEGFADAIGMALEMTVDERCARMTAMRAAVARCDVHEWVRDFLAHANAATGRRTGEPTPVGEALP